MNNEIFPKHFESWKKCITEKCNIELTEDFINKRITSLSDLNSNERNKFIALYGESWAKTILTYFNQALRKS